MTRCKVGDLAICIRSAPSNPIDPLGKICRVIRAAPGSGGFLLPDGYMQAPGLRKNMWVVEWASEMSYPTGIGDRLTKFGVMPDYALRPIRNPGDDAVDEVLQRLPAPTIHSQIKEDKSQEVTS